MSDKILGSDLLPVVIDYEFTGLNGNLYFVEIEVYETENLELFPEGVNATFRLFKIDENGERQIIYLIDNHAPYGFHKHNELPGKHKARNSIHVKSWQEAWDKFQAKCREKTI